MRFLLAVGAIVVGVSVMSVAQRQPKEFKAKPAPKVETAPKSTPTLKTSGATSTSATSKELRNAERGTGKTSGAMRAPKNGSGKAKLKPAKERPNPPISFGGKSGASGGSNKHADPYKGRLKQKGQGHH
jgi:hypothetical protein